MPGVEIQQIGADMINACAIALAEHKLTMVTDTTPYETSEAQVEAWLRLGPAAVIDLMGMRRAARRAGATLSIEEVELDRDAMHAAVGRALRRRPRPDGICAYNDGWAVGLLDALGARKIRVPGDLAVIGVNDEPIARAVTPTITTVRWPVEEFGEAVAAATAALVRGEGTTHELPLPDLTVVVRESA